MCGGGVEVGEAFPATCYDENCGFTSSKIKTVIESFFFFLCDIFYSYCLLEISLYSWSFIQQKFIYEKRQNKFWVVEYSVVSEMERHVKI